MPEVVLDAAGLSKRFPGRRGSEGVLAVDAVDFALHRGETLGLVGESGCGKSTLSRLVLCLLEPDEGSVLVAGAAFSEAQPERRRELRRHVQIVFQDALSSLNPRMTAGTNVAEPLRLLGLGTAAERRDEARRLLGLVGLRAGDEHRYPHEFSGGQCQRVAIARALAPKPDVVVFDEAVSALDVSVRAQVLRLILDVQARFGLAALFISHDLGVVKRVCDRIAVMYAGRLVEVGPAAEVCARPAHPYTEALLRAVPVADPRRMRVDRLGQIAGEATARADGRRACAFAPRCPAAFERCSRERPASYAVGTAHRAACFLHDSGPGV